MDKAKLSRYAKFFVATELFKAALFLPTTICSGDYSLKSGIEAAISLSPCESIASIASDAPLINNEGLKSLLNYKLK